MIKIYNDFEYINKLNVKTILKKYILVDCINDLKSLLYILNEFTVKFIIIGLGSKILFKNEIYDGVVIAFSKNYKKIDIKNNYVYVDAGCTLNELIWKCYEYNLKGLNKLICIPATIGGAIYMNCGIDECDISSYLLKVVCLTPNGKIKILNKEDCDFSYRNSIFKNNKLVIVGALFNLIFANKEEIIKEIKYQINKRLLHQEINVYTCGSLFKNTNNIKAYKLIENSFDISKNYNGAHISKKHHNFLINDSNASSNDIISLINDIKKQVFKTYKIELELELNIIE